jgi:radical SAM protein with 4Fe4S-binding SPASM domain
MLIRKAQNYLSLIANYKFKRTAVSHYPREVWIEPTNHCNLKCIMCPQSKNDVGERGLMDFRLFEKIIDQCSKFQPFIQLFMGGESLIHKDIVRMIRCIKDNGMNVLLATNATLLTRSLSLDLLESNLDYLVFSLDGDDRETYERVRVGARFDVTIGNIERFLELKREMAKEKPITNVYSLCLDKERTFEEQRAKLEALHNRFLGLKLDKLTYAEAGPWAGRLDSDVRFKVRERGERFVPCPRIWNAMAIRWDGKVVPCCADLRGDVVLGDVKEKEIEKIWNGERLVAMRKLMVQEKYEELPLCRECDEPFPSSTMMKWGLHSDLLPGFMRD